MILAAYVQGLRLADTLKKRQGRPGGGARRRAGLPTNPGQMVSRLRALGAQVDEPTGSAMVMVTFAGQQLGKVNVGPTASKPNTASKPTVESDYQRCVRRIDAITRRSSIRGVTAATPVRDQPTYPSA